MLWVKMFHILFVISWMAGIFYLPRIFVHYAEGQAAGEDVRRLVIMARKLFNFMTIIMIPAVATGFWLWLGWGISGGWLHAKLTFVALLLGYHYWTLTQVRRMEQDGRLSHDHVFYRWMNEIPLLLLVGILIMVVIKPF
ncbi:CopD family protein [Sulfurivirga sp.]|uniref:CopD family protein n=1 Tax=Sulfurivirga sp. TaxID=2614236 RepID=UPI0025D1014B|nr:CopD family protein [Sulfurivirga sp.]